MSKLDATYTFWLPRATTEEEHELIRAIPGTVDYRKTRSPRVVAPYNAGWLVAPLLQAPGGPGVRKVTTGGCPPSSGHASDWAFWRDHLLERGEVAETIEGEPLLAKWLKPFQVEPVTFLANREAGTLWAAGGAGKTIMGVLAALCSPKELPVLVVTRGGARGQWYEEASRYTRLDCWQWKPASALRKTDRTLEQYLDDQRSRGARAFVVAGWEQLVDIVGPVADVLQPGVVLWDEVHLGKQPKRRKYIESSEGDLERRDIVNQSSIAYKITTLPSVQWRIATTATPIFHRLWDLWGQLTLVEPWAWSETWNRFRFRHCSPEEAKYGYTFDGMSNVEELRQRLSFSVIQIPYKTSHGDLPPKRRRLCKVPLEQQKKDTSGAAAELKARLKEAAKLGGDERSDAVGRLKEVITELKVQIACSMKRGVIVEHVLERTKQAGSLISPDAPEVRRKGKCIVMVGRVDHVALFEGLIATATRLPEGALWGVSGGDSLGVRDSTRQAYMAHPGPCVLIGTWQSIGQSLNFQDTDYMAIGHLPYVPGAIDQIEQRIQRLGMNRECEIEYFIAERSIDERIKRLILDKLPSVEAITSGVTSASGLVDVLRDVEHRPERMMALLDKLGEDFDDVDLPD